MRVVRPGAKSTFYVFVCESMCAILDKPLLKFGGSFLCMSSVHLSVRSFMLREKCAYQHAELNRFVKDMRVTP